MTTVRHVSQCSILRYSFSFSHKCPCLVGASSRWQSDALCENAHHNADSSSAQWQLPPSSATRRAQFSQNLACPQAPRQSLRSVPTNILRNTVMVCLQQLALLAPTLRPTRWQQSVSTARRRRRRNCRRVGWAVARRCERQRRGSQHAGTATCRTHHCRSGTRMP